MRYLLILFVLLGWTASAAANPHRVRVPHQTPEEELAAAVADYQQQSPELQVYTRYLSLRTASLQHKELFARQLMFMVPSSSREVLLDQQIPVRVPNTDLYRINLFYLSWDVNDWLLTLKKYPYSYVENPLIIRGDWLISELSDNKRSKAYVNLLYGSKKIPKNRAELFKLFKVREDQQFILGFGLIAQKSPVSVAKERWIEHFIVDQGYGWQTKDVFEIKDGQGPLDKPDGKFHFDGTEIILGIPKISVAQKTRGALQIYQLGNGQETRVDEADARLVEDYTAFKGTKVIVNMGSCVQCHITGINDPQVNGLEKLIVDGVELSTKLDKQAFLDRFHLTDSGKEIRRNQEDYNAAVRACNGLSAEQNALAFREAIHVYWQDLGLAEVARELNATPAELRLALAWASVKYLELGSRFAGLAHDRPITRATMETGYLKAQEVLKIWRSKP